MRSSNKKILKEYGIVVAVAVLVALLIRFYVLEAYRIPTPAMHPALEPGDTIFVHKWPMGFDRKARRGDVVVFESRVEPGRDYIKRVLGLAGDLVEVRKGQVLLNDKPLLLPLADKAASCGQERVVAPDGERDYSVCWGSPLLEDFGPARVPDDSVFVLADSRTVGPNDSKKRRTWGVIPVASLKGRAAWIWLSIEPRGPGATSPRFPRIRFERMFRRIP